MPDAILTTAERWLPCPGHPGFEVSDRGHVKGRRGNVMTPVRHARGRLKVTMRHDGRRHDVSVHVLVLEAFAGPRPLGYFGCHLNDVPTDNRLSNLRWQTRADNHHDAVRNGRMQHVRLTPGDVRAIRATPRRHGVVDELARRFGVSRAAIRDVRSRHRWRWVAGGAGLGPTNTNDHHGLRGPPFSASDRGKTRFGGSEAGRHGRQWQHVESTAQF